jgi:SAM-dependent methyltransferase
MYSSQHTVHIYNRHVKEYMNRFMDLGLYKDTFEFLLETLPPGGNVLELGCGPGNVAKHMLGKRPDLYYLGIDLAPEMIKAAKEENPGAEFQLLDIRNADRIEGRFDAVIAAFSIPYLSSDDLPGVMANMSRLTAENGMIYLSFMEGARERSGFEKTSFTGEEELYISYYPAPEIELLLKENGFEIKRPYSQDYPEADGSVTKDIIYIAGKR